MLKPNDPAWTDLFADIQAVVSCRYVESMERPSNIFPAYMESRDGSGFEFSELQRGDRMELLTDADFWLHYEDLGLSDCQEVAILNNILEGKPPEKWFDGVFDREAETLTLAQILEGVVEDHAEHMRARRGREM